MSADPVDSADSTMEELALAEKKLQEKHKYCEICRREFDTPWNYRRHTNELHLATNTPEILAKRKKQNQIRNVSRKARYANDPEYKQRVKLLSATSNLKKKRATGEQDGEGSDDAGGGTALVKKTKMSNTDPVHEKQVEEHTASSRKGGVVADSAHGKTEKKTCLRLTPKLVTKTDLEMFFKPRSSVSGSDKST